MRYNSEKTDGARYFISIVSEDLKGVACIGYVRTLVDAKRVIEANVANILDNAKYAVIERVKPGLFMFDENPTIYQVCEGGIVVKMLAKPELFTKLPRGGIGFGIAL